MSNLARRIRQRGFRQPQVDTEYFACRGGIDIETPITERVAGTALAAQNYELRRLGGYRRIDGYERYDGQLAPSDATYWLIDFDAGGTTAIAVDDTLDDAAGSPSKQGRVLAVVLESGSWAGSDAAGYLIVGKLNGAAATPAGFADNDALYVSGTQLATAAAAAVERGAATDTLDDTYIQAAIEALRDEIAKPTGSGAIRGVWVYNGDVYCVRDNAGGTAGVLYKATTSGWAAQTLSTYIKFDKGTAAIAAGDTITGDSSGASADVDRVVLRTGTWAGGDAEGLLIISNVSGAPFTDNEKLQVSAANKADADGTETTHTLPAGGTWEFVNYNFFGSAQSIRMYGVNGEAEGLEWDGTVSVPIFTDMTTDTPIHVAAHQKHLFFAFPNGSLQHSSIGDPYGWAPLTGASEIGTGDEITGLTVLNAGESDGAMAVFNRNQTYVLYGTSSADWVMRTFSMDTGAIEWSIQNMSYVPVFFDDRGLTDMRSVQAFGNFDQNTIVDQIASLAKTFKTKILSSVSIKDKGQYRVFFNDGTGWIVTFSYGKPMGVTTFSYGSSLNANVACQGEDDTGNELVFIGGSDGMVYQLEKGTSFDGSAVEAFVRLHHYHYGSPMQEKTFYNVYIDIEGEGNGTISFQPEFDYGSDYTPEEASVNLTVLGSGGYYDINNWDEIKWSSPTINPIIQAINGDGVNMGLFFYSNTIYTAPHTLHGVTTLYSMGALRT